MLRHAVLECLVARHPVALAATGVARRVRSELDFAVDDSDVDAALAMLGGLALVAQETDELGSSRWWRATPAGVLRVERGGK